MKKRLQKLSYIFVCALLLLSLCACGGKSKDHYKKYVKSLISINYINSGNDYKDTGSTKQDADALYEANMNYFADQIIAYYNVTLTDAHDLLYPEYVRLAKSIYTKVNYSVSDAYEKDGTYYVDVTILPIDFFNQTYDDVLNYINSFNEEVQRGKYNSYTLEQYETTFSAGLLTILDRACVNLTYADPVTITVEIIENGESFYISDSDFAAIDNAMIASSTNDVPAEPSDETEGNE